MGARFLGMEEAAGSTPASSTRCLTNKGGTAGINPSLDRAGFFICDSGQSRPSNNQQYELPTYQVLFLTANL